MPNFNKPGRDRGSKSFGRKNFGKRSFDGRNSGKPGMHKAICDECGNPCEVPFKPTGNKPVFCNNCFRNDGGNNRKGDKNGSNSSVNIEQFKEQLEILNIKLDRIFKILTTPRQDLSQNDAGNASSIFESTTKNKKTLKEKKEAKKKEKIN